MKTTLMMILVGMELVGCGRFATSSDETEGWNPANDPLRLDRRMVRRFSSLALDGRSENVPWSDNYWPSIDAGIAHRWRESVDDFNYNSPTRDEFKKMTLGERSKLSPAEKFDILNGDFSYPMVRSERRRTHGVTDSWQGLCHGWAPASINFKEPHAVMAKTRDGEELPFGATDVKAILTYYQGQATNAPFKMLGQRCNIDLQEHPEERNNPACRDINAGSFHVALTNLIGRERKALVGDVTRDLQVWNQPIYAFHTDIVKRHGPSRGAAPGTVSEVVLSTTITYGLEAGSHWHSGGDDQSSASKTYQYRVELDGRGDVIGGEWNEENRPDFLWTQERPEFRGNFSAFGQLYQDSLRRQDLIDPDRA